MALNETTGQVTQTSMNIFNKISTVLVSLTNPGGTSSRVYTFNDCEWYHVAAAYSNATRVWNISVN